MAARRNWTEEEIALACCIYLYPEGRMAENIAMVARMTGRTEKAVRSKIDNLARFDEEAIAAGRSYRPNGSKLDSVVWNKFMERPEEMQDLVGDYIRNCGMATEDDLRYAPSSGTELIELGDGYDYECIVTQRANQSAFRRVVLRYAGNRCCLTGVGNPQLLIASHIKPWSECTPKEKTDVHNALCLNVLHDALFDRHLMTVDTDMRAHYDPELEKTMGEEFFESSVARYERVRIGKHNRPDERYLEHHNRLFTEKTGVRI